MPLSDYFSKKNAFVFDYDNTLYPEKDYLYQVYYMMAQFVEYHDGIPHEQSSQFLIATFEKEGRERLFDRYIEQFSLPQSYMENFLRLLRSARLPLKLLLYKQMEEYLQHLISIDKKIFLLTNGNPDQQYNKIIQTEWNGIDKHLPCYFANEIKPKPAPDALLLLISEHQLDPSRVLFVGDAASDEECARSANIDYYKIS